MKHFLLGLLAASSLLSSCASIVSHSKWPVAISSSPNGASVTVTNRRGESVYTGTTPAVVILKSGSSFFKREIYKLDFNMPGYGTKTTTLEADVNGWYFGNLVFGGAIGMLIVDPASGAMYRIAQKDVQVSLSKTEAMNFLKPSPTDLQIVSIDQVPTALRDHMVPLK